MFKRWLRERDTDCYCPIDDEDGSIVLGMNYIGECPGELVGEFFYREGGEIELVPIERRALMWVIHDESCPALSSPGDVAPHDFHFSCNCSAPTGEQLRELVEAIGLFRAVFELPFSPGVRDLLRDEQPHLYEIVLRQEVASSRLDAALVRFRKTLTP